MQLRSSRAEGNAYAKQLQSDIPSNILRKMKPTMLAILSLVAALAVHAQQARSQGTRVRHQTAPIASTSKVSPPPPTTATGPDQERIRELTHRVQKLELEIIQKSEPSSGEKVAIIAAIIAASAVLLTAILSLVGQFVMATREEGRAVVAAQRALEHAKQEAVFRQTERILEFRLKQMEQFYAPMFALLRQSRGLYDKMQFQLAQDEPQRYKLLAEADSDGSRMQVCAKDGTWKDFRLLDQLPAVRANPKALALVDGILQIGKNMTGIISTRAGLASEDLVGLLGQYMAHYAILSTIYMSGETEPYEPGWHKMGYYPRELNGQIEKGYRVLSKFLDEYVDASNRMLAALPGSGGKQQP
jgi:hypothetical protein